MYFSHNNQIPIKILLFSPLCFLLSIFLIIPTVIWMLYSHLSVLLPIVSALFLWPFEAAFSRSIVLFFVVVVVFLTCLSTLFLLQTGFIHVGCWRKILRLPHEWSPYGAMTSLIIKKNCMLHPLATSNDFVDQLQQLSVWENWQYWMTGRAMQMLLGSQTLNIDSSYPFHACWLGS